MATTRQSIVRGPGTVTFDSIKFFDKDGISANVESSTEEIPSSASGTLDTIKTDQVATVTLTPVGNITADILSKLFPAFLKKPVLGSSLMGSTDKSLVVSSRAGQKVTFVNAAITGVPELRLSPVATAFGQVTFSALVANGKTANETGGFYSTAAAAYADGEAPRTNLTGHVYTGTFGSLSIPDTVDGWTVSVEPNYEPVRTDSQGTIDYTLQGVTVRASCTPLGLSEAQILAALPTTKGRGASLASTNDLVISAQGGLTVTLKNASLVTGPIQWGSSQLRVGQLGFVANIASTGDLFDVVLTPESK